MLRALVPAILSLFLWACALSTPSPSGGHRLDTAPRVPGPGRMNTSLGSGVLRTLGSSEEISLRLGQAYVLSGGLQVGGVLESASLLIRQASLSPDTPDIEAEGYYAGVFLKRSLGRAGRIAASAHGGLGMGGFGEYVGYADAYGGAAAAWDSRILSPFVSATTGLSLPYRRRTFEVKTSSFFVSGSSVGRYRFASAALVSWEFGLESPFGDAERGLRASLTLGQRFYRLLEADLVEPEDGNLPFGMESTTRLGLSWTY